MKRTTLCESSMVGHENSPLYNYILVCINTCIKYYVVEPFIITFIICCWHTFDTEPIHIVSLHTVLIIQLCLF